MREHMGYQAPLRQGSRENAGPCPQCSAACLIGSIILNLLRSFWNWRFILFATR